MTDERDKERSDAVEVASEELEDLEWDDALHDLEREVVGDGNLGPHSRPTAPPPPRPFYRPPTREEIERGALAPPRPLRDLDITLAMPDEDDGSNPEDREPTRVAENPTARPGEYETKPPAPQRSPNPRPTFGRGPSDAKDGARNAPSGEPDKGREPSAAGATGPVVPDSDVTRVARVLDTPLLEFDDVLPTVVARPTSDIQSDGGVALELDELLDDWDAQPHADHGTVITGPVVADDLAFLSPEAADAPAPDDYFDGLIPIPDDDERPITGAPGPGGGERAADDRRGAPVETAMAKLRNGPPSVGAPRSRDAGTAMLDLPAAGARPSTTESAAEPGDPSWNARGGGRAPRKGDSALEAAWAPTVPPQSREEQVGRQAPTTTENNAGDGGSEPSDGRLHPWTGDGVPEALVGLALDELFGDGDAEAGGNSEAGGDAEARGDAEAIVASLPRAESLTDTIAEHTQPDVSAPPGRIDLGRVEPSRLGPDRRPTDGTAAGPAALPPVAPAVPTVPPPGALFGLPSRPGRTPVPRDPSAPATDGEALPPVPPPPPAPFAPLAPLPQPAVAMPPAGLPRLGDRDAGPPGPGKDPALPTAPSQTADPAHSRPPATDGPESDGDADDPAAGVALDDTADTAALFTPEARRPAGVPRPPVAPRMRTTPGLPSTGRRPLPGQRPPSGLRPPPDQLPLPPKATSSPLVPAVPPADRTDAGALAARRTVRRRKPREEHLPLVGQGAEVLRQRRDLLRELASRAESAGRARCWVAAAELSEQLGDGEAAQREYGEALAADPRDVLALRALRRHALTSGDFAKVAALLETEASLALSLDDRAAAQTLLAEVLLMRLDDPAGAEKAARTATGLARKSVAAALLLAECCLAQHRTAEALTALERAAELFNDPRAKAALWTDLALTLERQGHGVRAHRRYAQAVEADPGSIDALLGAARCALASGEPAAEFVAQAATLLPASAVGLTMLRTAARVQHLAEGSAKEAAQALEDHRSVLGLAARVDAVADSEGREGLAEALASYAAASGGTDRALALVRLAELRSAEGDTEAADRALKDAALADSSLGTIRVTRELLARRTGSAAALAGVIASSQSGLGALAAAAKMAHGGGKDHDGERELLVQAREEGDSPVTADVLELDLATTGQRGEDVRGGLRRQVERASPDRKLGPLLLLASLADLEGDAEGRMATLREALDVAPGESLALRPLSRTLERANPTDAAALLLEEAAVSQGDRAAFAALAAARVLLPSGQPVIPVLRRALAAAPRCAAAGWAVLDAARAAGDIESMASASAALSEIEELDATSRGGHLLRAALVTADQAPVEAARLLRRALAIRPADAVVTELILRLSDASTAAERAVLLKTQAEQPGQKGPAKTTADLRLAAAYEDADMLAEAAAVYHRIIESDPGSVVAGRSLDHCELRSGAIARVAERHFERVRHADTEQSRVRALMTLADLDFYERNDPGSAMMSLQSILESDPSHRPSLRLLENYFMSQARDEDLAGIEERLARQATTAADRAAHARVAAKLLLAPADAKGQVADELFLDVANRGIDDFWLARRVIGASGSRHSAATTESLAILGRSLESPTERAVYALWEAGERESAQDLQGARQVLERALAEAPDHPVVAEELAQLLVQTQDHAAAAAAFDHAARLAMVPGHKAALSYRSGVLYADHLANPTRAAQMFERTAAIDVTHLDVFDRLNRLLSPEDDGERLAQLTLQRIQAGGDAQTLVALQIHLADLREASGDLSGATSALHAALAIDPERPDLLRRVAQLSLAAEDYRDAAEALIRIARIRKDREELRWVFYSLGDIYDQHIPDARRSEAAFQRVLKLIPDDVEALERLAKLYQRIGNVKAHAETLHRLAEHEVDPEKNRDHRLTLAQALEQTGHVREAETTLEQTRRNAPTDLVVLKTIGEFYQRQNAQPALAMHLNRAVNDFRHAITTDPGDAAAWPGLVEVLTWRGRTDAARCAASAAASLGIVDVVMARHVDAGGGIPGFGSKAADPTLDELWSPSTLSPATRAVFRLTAAAFDRVMHFDLKAVRATKATRDNPFRQTAAEVAGWFGEKEPQLYITAQAPRVCLPVSSDPTEILVGQELVASLDESQRRFLIVRAMKIATMRMTAAVRTQPEQLALGLSALIRCFDPTHSPEGVDYETLDDLAARFGKALPRRTRNDLMPLVLEMAGSPYFRPIELGVAAAAIGNSAGLLAIGSVPTAIASLLRLAGDPAAANNPAQRLATIRDVPEALALVAFAISDVYFEARQRAAAQQPEG